MVWRIVDRVEAYVGVGWPAVGRIRVYFPIDVVGRLRLEWVTRDQAEEDQYKSVPPSSRISNQTSEIFNSPAGLACNLVLNNSNGLQIVALTVRARQPARKGIPPLSNQPSPPPPLMFFMFLPSSPRICLPDNPIYPSEDRARAEKTWSVKPRTR